VAVGSKIHGAGLAILIRSPWKFLISQAGPSTFENFYRQVLIFIFYPLASLDSLNKGPFHSFLHLDPSVLFYNYVLALFLFIKKPCKLSFLADRSL
jgi:hypothetical protein